MVNRFRQRINPRSQELATAVVGAAGAVVPLRRSISGRPEDSDRNPAFCRHIWNDGGASFLLRIRPPERCSSCREVLDHEVCCRELVEVELIPQPAPRGILGASHHDCAP